MVLFKDMMIDTAYPLTVIEDRGDDRDPLTSECTYCRRADGWGVRHPIADVTVVRRWTVRSYWDPKSNQLGGGGRYEWRCTEHPYNGDSSTHAADAPQHLIPERRERCEEITLKTLCTKMTSERYEGRWLCSEHAASVVERLRIEERLRAITEGWD
ncbi:MAG: hypothetical protein BGN97_07750 [Microbacterium sp. 69-10]|uniref:hypothetical protein n=1 Tax=Microbacterium sp. 69-10 TaxID=1895783 RepID=UPI00096270BB|nr:hypothetical protein [Microbacterium sp. 69-10]OJU42398.1 MAG: hypothetical protein BGN97_07750 [Microbacterium sp. 69-10]